MTIRALPGVPVGRPQIDVRSYISPQALNRWDSSIRASAEQDADERTIGIYDVIGHDYWTGEGFTAKRMSAALRSLGKGPVTVSINSPGGDMFEGIAMYSMLREHRGEVTIKVMGLAASAASVIAMGGDDVRISRPAFLMIHNCWLYVPGNRHELRAVADQIEPFDTAMADVYAARTGEPIEAMARLMDRETWIGGSAAVDQGFADALLDSDEVKKAEAKTNAAAVRRLESALRASGMSKSEAMKLISDFKSGAGDPAGSGEGDPTEYGRQASTKEAACLAGLQLFKIT
ncbi:MAG: Clp protease ClpP [Stenotrophomonas nitritireducens]|uniref:ATP-dependent Clp protease proteolytic subunit n=1 Tax=Stenotrophomonas nitritireducens TaxID=83617 RepID=A0A9D8KYC6_9GAMM|nr:head maturation protease, ClpP-related [Stenotrophomonas nitritireducens]MBN8791706.1 Clp protease ClpP [Stenotrophomonas nitritireducens]MBN8795644.1 Clp protease ClpP [Stenotrophomonas nitritireducens]MBN8799178.1 Clp protease ClpP [Stenotrophomonas nitritireducens]